MSHPRTGIPTGTDRPVLEDGKQSVRSGNGTGFPQTIRDGRMPVPFGPGKGRSPGFPVGLGIGAVMQIEFDQFLPCPARRPGKGCGVKQRVPSVE